MTSWKAFKGAGTGQTLGDPDNEEDSTFNLKANSKKRKAEARSHRNAKIREQKIADGEILDMKAERLRLHGEWDEEDSDEIDEEREEPLFRPAESAPEDSDDEPAPKGRMHQAKASTSSHAKASTSKERRVSVSSSDEEPVRGKLPNLKPTGPKPKKRRRGQATSSPRLVVVKLDVETPHLSSSEEDERPRKKKTKTIAPWICTFCAESGFDDKQMSTNCIICDAVAH